MSKKKGATQKGVSKEDNTSPDAPEEQLPSTEAEESTATQAAEEGDEFRFNPFQEDSFLAREKIAEEYAARQAAELGVEAEEEPVDKTAETEEPEETESQIATEDSEDDSLEAATEEEPTETEPTEQAKEKLVIDGEEKEVELEKILDAGRRALQKDLAADKRLEEASRLNKEATERLRKVEELEQQRKEQEAALKKEVSQEEDATAYEKVVEAIQVGDTEEAVEALKSLLGRQVQPTEAIPEEVAKTVDRKLAEYKHVQIRERFWQPTDKGGFLDLVPEDQGGTGDPYLFQQVNARVDELVKSGEPDEWSTYEKAGKLTREWRDRLLNQSTGSTEEKDESIKEATRKTDEERKLKQERKRKLDVVKSVSETHQVGETEEPEETVASVVNEMRRSRGLPV